MSDVWKKIPDYPMYSASSIGEIKRLGITRGKVGKVLSQWNNGTSKHMKLRLCVEGKMHTEYVHRLVLSAFTGKNLIEIKEVDHADGNPKNNNIQNLRECNRSQNMRNARKPKSGKTSEFKGVCWDKRGCWAAYGSKNSKTVLIGRYDCELEAAHAYDDYAKKNYGEFANVNFSEADNV